MDAATMYQQGFGPAPPRQRPAFVNPGSRPPPGRDDPSDGDSSSSRIAHTLTACCRCRQRKTRCDPTLPRCLPCERSGSVCEYLDAAKGRKINRYYVIKLQDKVRALEADLNQYTDDETECLWSSDDMVRPGGMVRLRGTNETPRYLGPSSGISMTRLLMEEAKRYTDSKRISDLIPEVRAQRQARMQSVQMTGPAASRKKSYPMISEHPAENLPTRSVADKLIEVFNQKAQPFWPVLHETDFRRDLEAVYNGDSDPFKLFIVRMVIAISLQKLGTQYAGLADSYYLAAMQLSEDVIRPKDLKTLQCLVLIGQYSLLTPIGTPTYIVIGLASRICLREGWADEKTITRGFDLNQKTIDLRRRVVWCVVAMEYGLAHSLGRPSNFAFSDRITVDFFATVDDGNITEEGIQSGPPSPRNLVAVHFFKMRICQAEIRKTLYEKKQPEPKNDSHPWYKQMESEMQEWLDRSPTDPPWCKSWFTARYYQMRVFLYRPSPQVPKPSLRAATICFESSKAIINLSSQQLEGEDPNPTWAFLLTVTMSLNTLLWTVSYPDVRQAHPREEVEELVNIALDVLERCSERWPGTDSASQLYAIVSKVCLQSYEARHTPGSQHASLFNTPPSFADPNSPESYNHAPNSHQQTPYANAPQFGQVFDSPPEAMNNYAFDPNFPPPQPTFRSNSIFLNPIPAESTGRRFSYFPPDFIHGVDTAPEDPTPPATAISEQHLASPAQMSEQLPTPPDSAPTGNMSTPTARGTHSPPNILEQTPTMHHKSPAPMHAHSHSHSHSSMSPPLKLEPSGRVNPFATPALPQQVQQRPLPPAMNNGDWFSPPPALMSPYSFGNMSQNYFNDNMTGATLFGDMSGAGLALQHLGPTSGGGPPMGYNTGRQGSLTQSQQLELMNVLETEGVGDIDAFLNGNVMTNARWY